MFLAALALIDDLGAVAITALFYTSQLSLLDLIGAAVAVAALVAPNRMLTLLITHSIRHVASGCSPSVRPDSVALSS